MALQCGFSCGADEGNRPAVCTAANSPTSSRRLEVPGSSLWPKNIPPECFLHGHTLPDSIPIKLTKILERAKGIEPSYSAWEADVLPLNYARKNIFIYYSGWKKKSQWQIRRILSVLYGKCPCENLWILRYWRYGKSVV